MTATMVAPAVAAPVSTQRRQSSCQTTSFRYSLKDGWNIDGVDLERAIQALRDATFIGRAEVVIGPKAVTPKTSSPEEKARVVAEIDAANAERRRRVIEFFERQLGIDPRTAALLGSRIKSQVTSIVAFHCPNDSFFTLMPEF